MANNNLTVDEFVIHAITTLRDESKSKGIHTVYSGFNQAFRAYFPGRNPVEETKRMAEAGKIVVGYRRGGAMLFLPGEAPVANSNAGAEKALAAMGLA